MPIGLFTNDQTNSLPRMHCEIVTTL